MTKLHQDAQAGRFINDEAAELTAAAYEFVSLLERLFHMTSLL